MFILLIVGLVVIFCIFSVVVYVIVVKKGDEEAYAEWEREERLKRLERDLK